jgi:hypothetical protein
MMETVSEVEQSKPLSWGETAAGILPLVVFSLATTLEGGIQGVLTIWLVWIFIFLLYAVPLAGILKAWERGFPRWSPPYLGLAVVDIVFFRSVMFEPLFQDIVPTFTLRVSILLMLIFFLIGAARRVRRGTGRAQPPAELDWAAFLFGAQVWMPFIVMVSMDEIPAAAKAPLVLACAAILVAGALVYLRARQRWVGVLGLAASMALAWWSAAFLAGWYWDSHPWGG